MIADLELESLFASVGGAVAAIATLITAIATLIKARHSANSAETAAKAASTAVEELQPNHGGSLKDIVTRMEGILAALSEKQAGQSELLRGLGHQVGEIRKDAAVTHEQLGDAVTDIRHRVRNNEQSIRQLQQLHVNVSSPPPRIVE